MNQPGKDIPNYRILLSRFTTSNQWDRALETANEWLSIEPENPRAHFAAGQALINLKRHTEAEPHVAHVLAGEPDNDLAHRMMSLIHFREGRFAAADESIQKAVSLNPNEAYHWYHLAWMRHKQDDVATALKYAEKARELSPRDSDIVNLVAICAPRKNGRSLLELQQYQEALELDPENAQVHNNIGAYYLNADKDYAKAEECFRRALLFDPTLKMARSNLFITLKRRDVVYRFLRAPMDFILQGFALARRNRVLYYLTLPIWLIAYRFLFVGLILWLALFSPTIKVYEYLTIGDILAKAGELDAKRGGFLGYRRWPLRVRLLIFGSLLCSFWGSIAWLAFSNTDARDMVLGSMVLAGLFIGIVLVVRTRWKQGGFRFRRRRNSKEIDKLLEPKLSPKK